VFDGNLHDIPMLAAFFVQHNDVVRFASFQLGADTGRGLEPGRDAALVSQAGVAAAIEKGVGVRLNFDALQGGHRSCNRYAMVATIGRLAFDALADGELVARIMRETAGVALERGQGRRAAWALAASIVTKYRLLADVGAYVLRVLWKARGEWFRASHIVPPIRKISFFTHNFMDACQLDADRIDACVFMAATSKGPMSMCAYNAERERILRKPVVLASGESWQPLALAPDASGQIRIPVKWLKGRSREAATTMRRQSAVNPK
jgi:7,8-dihydro-6-hydroxymethylpterin dimethyltransferase